MKKTSLSIILLVALLAAISNAYAQSGPPPMQEVEATGQAADADAAFKQAVNDAVRQVVGTLVSAENVINNERVIKDQVLTLSDGFVEKVLNQDKTKLDDGTWQVKLKCIVRKGQVYGRLQEVKVPTVKFEGVSLFADVVSQQTVEKDAAALLIEAILGWNGSFYEAVSISPKPEIIKQNETTVEIRIPCRVTLNRAVYEKQFLGKLKNLLENIAVSKVSKTLSYNEIQKIETESHHVGDRMIYDESHGVKVIYVDGASVGYVVNDAVINKTKTVCFNNDHMVNLNLFAVFRDSSDFCLLIRKNQTTAGGLYTGTQVIGSKVNISPKFHKDYDYDSYTRDVDFIATIPLEYLSRITKIELHVATTLDQYLTSNKLPVEAPGGIVYLSHETLKNNQNGWLWKFVKASGDRGKVGGRELFYLPTLQMSDSQSEEFNTKTK